MDSSCTPVLVLFGPTASGKTSLAGHLFSADAPSVFAGKAELVSADSMQVYRSMDIGTAKPAPAFTAKLPHHLIDLCPPDEQFSAAMFVERADEACAAIYARGKLPVLCGGTAFYIKNFIYGLPVTPEADAATREKLRAEMQLLGAEKMLERLRAADPERAAQLHVHDEYRILRALEVYEATGKPLSDFAPPAQMRSRYDFLVIALERPREELYGRINARVLQMMEAGLPEEFRRLAESGFKREDAGMQAIGYREFFAAAEELGVPPQDAPSELVAQMIQRDSRKYAKKQMAFFKNVPHARWFNAQDERGIACAVGQWLAQNEFPGFRHWGIDLKAIFMDNKRSFQ